VRELVINGGNPLWGEVRLQGSKNASLPILAATILTDEECIIHNCPDISDTWAAIDILKDFGIKVCRIGETVRVCSACMDGSIIRKELMQKMRSSVMFMGAVLAKRGETLICHPGGCRLGDRPIDIHIKALSELGARIEDVGECIYCELKEVKEDEIVLLYPSVGATENIMMMCAGSGKVVQIYNAAREPEIVDLQNFLNAMGADIQGAGTDIITIRGVKELHGCEYTVMPDRVVAATIACAAAVCSGDVYIKEAKEEHIRLVVQTLREVGCRICSDASGVRVVSKGDLNGINMIKTLPYPGFPTDAQPMLGAVLTRCRGVSRISETIFDNRFCYLEELGKMGADTKIQGTVAEIRGVDKLKGANVAAKDLRGGAALVVAGLAAEGITVVSGTEFIDRGYEKIETAFKEIGANITRI